MYQEMKEAVYFDNFLQVFSLHYYSFTSRMVELTQQHQLLKGRQVNYLRLKSSTFIATHQQAQSEIYHSELTAALRSMKRGFPVKTSSEIKQKIKKPGNFQFWAYINIYQFFKKFIFNSIFPQTDSLSKPINLNIYIHRSTWSYFVWGSFVHGVPYCVMQSLISLLF